MAKAKAKKPRRNPLKGLVIRTAVAAGPGFGFIYAADPKREKKGTPYTAVYTYEDGAFDKGDYNYDAHSACHMLKPCEGILDVTAGGTYTVVTEDEVYADDLTAHVVTPKGKGKPPVRRGGYLRSVATIAGVAHAVGLNGSVYRFDKLRRWTDLSTGLPPTMSVQAIHGASLKNLIAVGHKGEAWRYDGARWKRCALPTKANLTAVCAAGDGVTYVAGHGGTLLRGRGLKWTRIAQAQTDDDIWDLEWFPAGPRGRLYVSTMEEVYWLDGDALRKVDFGTDPPGSSYQLSSADGVMWSSGESDVMSFDGEAWTRVV